MKIETYTKKNKKWPKNLSLLDRSLLPLRLQVFIREIQRVEEYEDRENWLFLNLNPLLISKLDLMWIFNSNLQLVGMLIAEYDLSNDKQ